MENVHFTQVSALASTSFIINILDTYFQNDENSHAMQRFLIDYICFNRFNRTHFVIIISCFTFQLHNFFFEICLNATVIKN